MSARSLLGCLAAVAAAGAVLAPAAGTTEGVLVVRTDAATTGAGRIWVGAAAVAAEGERLAAHSVLPPHGTVAWRLAPGRYRVLCAGDAGGWRRLEAVVVGPGGQAEVTCRLPRLGRAEIVVKSLETGRPVEGVEVVTEFALDAARSWPAPALPFLRSGAAAVSDGDGRARLALPAGTVATLLVRGGGIATTAVPAVTFRPGAPSRRTVRVAPGGSLDVRLEPASPEELDGAGLEAVPLGSLQRDAAVAEPSDGGARALLARLRRVRPGPDGRVVWHGLAPGAYLLRLVRPRGRSLQREELAVAVVRPLDTTTMDLRVGRVVVTGTVRGIAPELLRRGADGSRTLAAGVRLTLDDLAVSVRDTAPRREPPTFRYRATLAADTPRAAVLRIGPDSVPLALLDPLRARDGELEADLELPPGRIEVRVVDAGGVPVPGATICLGIGGAGTPRRLRSDASGRASFLHVAAGRWWVAARREGVGASAPRPVTVGRGAARVTVALEPGLALEGRVTGVGGRPVAGARIWCAPRVVPTLVASAVSDPDGRFRILDLPPAPVVMGARGPAFGTGFAVAEADPRLGLAPELVLPRASAQAALLLFPDELRRSGAVPGFVWEIGDVRVDGYLAALLAPQVASAGASWSMVLPRGWPPGRYRLSVVDLSSDPGRVLARLRPFELVPGEADAVAAVELELER